MEETDYGPLEIEKLDLAGYGLGELEGRDLLGLTADELDRLLEALGREDISLNIPLRCTPENVERLLATSECRRCGKCCIPNPQHPTNPGVEAFIEEIKDIAGYLGTTVDELTKTTSEGKIVFHPFEPGRLTFTRWLPLPCPYYMVEEKSCRIHSMRPVVCRIHPIIFTGDSSYMSVKVRCDYGKDLVRAALPVVREAAPDMEIIL